MVRAILDYRLNKTLHALKPYIKRHGLNTTWLQGIIRVDKVADEDSASFIKQPEAGDELLLRDMEKFALRMKRLDNDIAAFNKRATKRVSERAGLATAQISQPTEHNERFSKPAEAASREQKVVSSIVISGAQTAAVCSTHPKALAEAIEASAPPAAKKARFIRSASGAMIPIDPALAPATPPARKLLPCPSVTNASPAQRMQGIINYNFPPGLFPAPQAIPRRLYPPSGRSVSQPLPMARAMPHAPVRPLTPDLPPLNLPASFAPMATMSYTSTPGASKSYLTATPQPPSHQQTMPRGRSTGKKASNCAPATTTSTSQKRKRSSSLLSPVSNLDSPRRRILKQRYWSSLQAVEHGDSSKSNGMYVGRVGKGAHVVPWVDWDMIARCEAANGVKCHHTHLMEVKVEEIDEEEIKRCKEGY